MINNSNSNSNRYQNIPIKSPLKRHNSSTRGINLDQLSFDIENPDQRMFTRKKINRQLMLAENATNQDASVVKNRIQALASEDSKMLKKIEETRKKYTTTNQIF